jgi:hypothetical protein
VYFYVLIAFIIVALTVLVCVSKADIPSARRVLKKLDLFFSTEHPVEYGWPVVSRQTFVGGFFAVLYLLLTALLVAFLVHGWIYTQFSVFSSFQARVRGVNNSIKK